MSEDLSPLPEYAAKLIRNSPVPISAIWDGWTNDLPVGLSKRKDFASSTARTFERHNRIASPKTIGMLTDALLRYYTIPGNSDLEHPQHGAYGWIKEGGA